MDQKKKTKKAVDRTITISQRLPNQKIRLRVSASRNDWELLYKEYFHQSPKPFDPDFYSCFIRPAIDETRKPKNIHNNSPFILMMKAQAAILYLFFSHYFKYRKKMIICPGYNFKNYEFDFDTVYTFMEKNGLPFPYTYFIQFETIIRDIQFALHRIPKNKHTPTLYVAYCMQTVYKSLLEEKKIKHFLELESLSHKEDLSNFQKTYITKGIELCKEHLKMNVASLKRYKKNNHLDLFRPDTDTLFCKSIIQLYVFHYSNIQRDPHTYRSVFGFVGHLLRVMGFILSNGLVKSPSLTPESKSLGEFLFEIFKDSRDLFPNRYDLNEEERFILTQAYDTLRRLS